MQPLVGSCAYLKGLALRHILELGYVIRNRASGSHLQQRPMQRARTEGTYSAFEVCISVEKIEVQSKAVTIV